MTKASGYNRQYQMRMLSQRPAICMLPCDNGADLYVIVQCHESCEPSGKHTQEENLSAPCGRELMVVVEAVEVLRAFFYGTVVGRTTTRIVTGTRLTNRQPDHLINPDIA